MDTYIYFNSCKCKKCYKCIKKCSQINGKTGNLKIDECDGTPEYRWEYVSCHHCNYICEEICPNGAIKIDRW